MEKTVPFGIARNFNHDSKHVGLSHMDELIDLLNIDGKLEMYSFYPI